jgi:hypothetical protein
MKDYSRRDWYDPNRTGVPIDRRGSFLLAEAQAAQAEAETNLLTRFRTEYADALGKCITECIDEGMDFEGIELIDSRRFDNEGEIVGEIKEGLSEEDQPSSPCRFFTTNASVTFDSREESSRVYASLFISKGGEKSCALFAFNGRSVEVFMVC